MKNTRAIGAAKEELATKYLEDKGYRIIARNWHHGRVGEIDIIAIDPKRYNREYLVFIEVKYREYSMNMSMHAINYQKIQQLKKLARAYLRENKIAQSRTAISFDFIAIHKEQIRHLQNIVA